LPERDGNFVEPGRGPNGQVSQSPNNGKSIQEFTKEPRSAVRQRVLVNPMSPPRDDQQRKEQAIMTIMTSEPTTRAVSARPTNPWAVAAFVLSLFGWYALPIPIMSAIFAFVALRQIKQRGEGGRGMAQFARAFAILLTAVILLRGGHTDWLQFANEIATATNAHW
jgi:hypothetical protein